MSCGTGRNKTLYHLPFSLFHLLCPPECCLSGKKLGFLAVLFFTIKGLLWLIVPFVIYKWGC